MERFFTQHHVMKDRDPDELCGHADSDSEASEDEGEISERVHSVHDPTGPWKQTPVDAPWGQPGSRPYAGSARRDFQSQHTGPKGVIKDYKAHKRSLREERARKEQERKDVLTRIAKGVTLSGTTSSSTSPNQVGVDSGCFHCDGGSDCECEDLVDAAFLQQYQMQRLQQMQQAATSRAHYGSLDFLSPTQFVQVTSEDAVDPQRVMVVHLYHPENYACSLVNTHLAQIALQIPHVKFAAMIAKDADDSIAIGDLPVFLLYRGNQHDDTIVNLSSELDGEFTLPRIHKFIQERLASM